MCPRRQPHRNLNAPSIRRPAFYELRFAIAARRACRRSLRGAPLRGTCAKRLRLGVPPDLDKCCEMKETVRPVRERLDTQQFPRLSSDLLPFAVGFAPVGRPFARKMQSAAAQFQKASVLRWLLRENGRAAICLPIFR